MECARLNCPYVAEGRILARDPVTRFCAGCLRDHINECLMALAELPGIDAACDAWEAPEILDALDEVLERENTHRKFAARAPGQCRNRQNAKGAG